MGWVVLLVGPNICTHIRIKMYFHIDVWHDVLGWVVLLVCLGQYASQGQLGCSMQRDVTGMARPYGLLNLKTFFGSILLLGVPEMTSNLFLIP